MSVVASDARACCAAAYSSAAARYLLGDSFHPGGLELTARLAGALAVGRGELVADIASGPGTSALFLARSAGCRVIGLDISAAAASEAARAGAVAGLDATVRFACADAEALPLPDASVDGVLCECALCLVPDKRRAVGEIARALRPGARLALSDVTAAPERLSPDLRSLEAWVGCLAGALPLPELADLVSDAGLRVEKVEQRDDVLVAMLDRIEARLRVARLLGAGPLAGHLETATALLASARTALGEHTIGYGVIIARR